MSRQLIEHLVRAVERAPFCEAPFAHLEISGVFPDEVYADMIRAMPATSDYRALPGRNGGNLRADGTSSRVKIDLFPELIRQLPAEKRKVWGPVGAALRSKEVEETLVRRLAAGMSRRFGERSQNVALFPIPVLTRDIPGYLIRPHTDTHWKAITVQLYLPRDEAFADIGTKFHTHSAEGRVSKAVKKIPFVPNSGYAFAVGNDTWHSADKVREDVDTRDSILLTYYVDAGPMYYLRNRGKRLGNLLASRLRRVASR